MTHVVFIIAHNTSVPYFNWFAQMAHGTEYKFSFVALNDTRPKMLDQMKELQTDCYWIPFSQDHRKTSMVKAFFKLIRLFWKIKPDIIHTNLFDDSFPGLLAARFAFVKKRVITKQDTFFHWNFAPQWVWADRLNNINATHIHAVSTNNKDFILTKEKADPRKVHLVRNGFKFEDIIKSDPALIQKFKATYDLSNRIVVGTVARFIQWKGHHLIIEAAVKLVEQYPDLLFLWVGYHPDNTYQLFLEEQIRLNKLEDNIKIVGFLEREMMPSFYQCLDIYLHPAINEPFGFAISEALMNEIPVITTRTGSSDLMEHLENGYVIDMGNSEQIVQGVQHMLSSTETRHKLAKNGKEYALKELSFKNMFEGYLSMYSN